MSWLRHMRTTQERRENGKRDFIVVEGYKVRIRAKRNQANLPCYWCDIFNRSWEDRTWKRHRRTQYK